MNRNSEDLPVRESFVSSELLVRRRHRCCCKDETVLITIYVEPIDVDGFKFKRFNYCTPHVRA